MNDEMIKFNAAAVDEGIVCMATKVEISGGLNGMLIAPPSKGTFELRAAAGVGRPIVKEQDGCVAYNALVL